MSDSTRFSRRDCTETKYQFDLLDRLSSIEHYPELIELDRDPNFDVSMDLIETPDGSNLRHRVILSYGFNVNDISIIHENVEYMFPDLKVNVIVDHQVTWSKVPDDEGGEHWIPVLHFPDTIYDHKVVCQRVSDGGSNTIHPHVSYLGNLCLGDYRHRVARMSKDGNYYLAMITIDTILRNYDPSSPHYRIETFQNNAKECCVCSVHKVNYTKVKRNIVCDDCVEGFCTDDFGLVDMPEKMEYCEYCNRKSSKGRFKNSKCQEFICESCKNNEEGIEYVSHDEALSRPNRLELRILSETNLTAEPAPF